MVVGVAKDERADEDPRSRLRMTAYHIVDASPVPWMRSHGRGGCVAAARSMPTSMSWCCVATAPLIGVDEEEAHDRELACRASRPRRST